MKMKSMKFAISWRTLMIIMNQVMNLMMNQITKSSQNETRKYGRDRKGILAKLEYVVKENGKRVIYVRVLRAIYGMLGASMLWYKKLRKDLEEYGFKFNPYNACIANKVMNGKQQTIRFHVDDLLSSHMDPKVNDEFFEWANKKVRNH